MRSLKSWFVKQSPPDRRSAERVLSPWLMAYDWSGPEKKKHDIRDISTSGVYLLTQERWPQGELVSISLRRKDQPEESSAPGVPVQVKAVRWGQDGVGFSFVEAKDFNLGIGESPLANNGDHKEPEEVRRRLRMAKASAFVDRICPSISGEVKVLLRDRLSTLRIGNALEIALRAESMLGSGPDADRKRAHPQLVMRILEAGSWTDQDGILQLWTGLFVGSCTDKGDDETNLKFINLLSDLASEHALIFSFACARATKVVLESGVVSSLPLICTMAELMKVTGMHVTQRIELDIDQLSVFGVLLKRVKASSYSSLNMDVDITPSSLGLELYARCHGHRGAPRDFYGLASRSVSAPGNEPSKIGVG